MSSIYVPKARALLVHLHLASFTGVLFNDFVQVRLVRLHGLLLLRDVEHDFADALILRLNAVHNRKHVRVLNELHRLGFAVDLGFHLAATNHFHEVLLDVDALVEPALLLDFLEAEGHVDLAELAHV